MKVLEQARAIEVPRAEGLRFGELVREVAERVNQYRLKAYAGNLAYRGLFAVFAVLVLTFAVLSIFDARELVRRMLDQMAGFLPDPVHGALERQMLRPVADSAPGRAPALRVAASVAGALYGLSALARGVIDAMNAMYDVDERRPFWKRQLASVAMSAGVLVMLIGALVLVALGPQVGIVLRILRWPALLGLVLVSYALIYAFAPSVKERFRTFSHGAVLALPLWTLFTLGFTQFVDRYSRFEQTYGSLAGIVVLLLYMFISALILLLGASVNHVVAQRSGRKAPEPSS